ncbi:MAG: UDP-N-acetylmuramoyl-L-alanine--D-glutamate ligase [Candidatus Komeilibacteria bacterium]
MFNLKEKKVVVMGLGLHGGGVGVAIWAAKHGAKVLVTDMKSRAELKDSLLQLKKFKNIQYRLGKHVDKDFQNVDIVVANPIVRKDNKYLKIARKNGALIYNDVSLFMDLCPCRVIGITGTKGKSTTSALLYHLVKNKNVYLGGNIRISPFTFLDKLKKNDWVILEMSSWQCEGLSSIKKSPHISVLTNLGIDHLNTYKSFAEYAKAKALVFKYQDKNDYAVLNKQDDYTKKLIKNIKAKKSYFNIKGKSGNYFLNNYIYYNNTKLISADNIKLIGLHNITNILTVLEVCSILKLSAVKVKKGLASFKGLSGRMEFVKNIKGVKYINDTTATAPIAAISSINSLDRPIILIAGGNDKKLDIENFASTIINKIVSVILLPGTATDKLVSIFKKKKFVDYILVNSMPEAVKTAKDKARYGDIVLLSPGATSFGSFVNEFDRGDQFIKAVKKLK